jgi:hypothetical protein
MEDALTWLCINSTDDDRAVILTDSLSLVTKLEHNKFKETWLSIVKNIQGTVESVYTPGHAGVSYNETADKLAGDAVAFGNLDMPASDVIASITVHERYDREYFTFSMCRLREREATRGGGSLVLLSLGDVSVEPLLKSAWVYAARDD